MRLLELRQIAGDSRKRAAHVCVMHCYDVIDEPIDGPPRHVIVVDEVRWQVGQGANHICRIRRRRLARVGERTAATATKVDAEPFENAGRSVIGRHDISNDRLECLAHVSRVLSVSG